MTDQSRINAEACSNSGGLCEHHEKLKPFEGTFKAEVKMWMGPGEPHVSTGTMVNSLDLGGRFLEQRYKGNETDGPFPNFEGRGWWGFNTIDKRYEGMWIDNASTFMQTDAGHLDESGNTWTMTGTMTNPETGQPMQKRSVITLEDENHHRMEMFFSTTDGGEFKAMEINYTRA